MSRGRPPGVGSVIGPYRVEAMLGAGATGVVLGATDQRLGRRVALRVLPAHLADAPGWQERFEAEAARLARLDSPHLVSVYDHGEVEGWPYLVTQYAAGGDLGRLLATRGPLPPALAATVCAQAAEGLADAHAAGVVHRDVRPGSVLLRDERLDRVHVYLAGLGLAHDPGSDPDGGGATPDAWHHRAPERGLGAPASPAADVYALGCVLWQALTGRPPYPGEGLEVAAAHLQQPVPQLPGADPTTAELNRVLTRVLAKDPASRGGAADLRDDLRRLGGRPPTPTPLPGPGVSSKDPGGGRRRTALLVGGGVLALVLLGGGAAALALRGSEDDPAPTSGDPTSDPTSTPAPVPTAPEERAVPGDVDGDGFGDVALADYDHVWLAHSDGSSFGSFERQRGVSTLAALGDVDGDRALDVITIDGTPPSVRVRARTAGGEVSSVLRVPARGYYADLEPLAGDFDADGDDDVAVLTVDEKDDEELSLTVSTDSSDGSTSSAAPWWTGRDDAWRTDEVQPVVGDLDGDGDDDVVLSTDAKGGQHEIVLLAGDGTFEEAVDQEVEAEYYVERIAGDFDADGTDEIALVDSGPTVTVESWDGSALERPTPWYEAPVSASSTSGVAASDVDGDGRTDLVVPDLDGLPRVYLSTSSDRFSLQRSWDPDFRLEGVATALGRSYTGY